VKRVLLMVGLSFGLVNCAAVTAARTGNLAGAAEAAAAEAKAAAQKIADAKAKADVDCKPLYDRIGSVDGDDAAKEKALADARNKGFGVSWNEERAIGGALAIGFAQTGKGLFCDITDKDVKALKEKGDKKRDAVKLPPGEKNDLNTYVQMVGDYVAQGSTRPGIAWTFGVIEDDSVNAVSTPGGYVYITTGLMKLMENEAQLAGVLAHEIGHVQGRHSLFVYSKGKAAACSVAVTGLYLVEAGASTVPGGEDFVKNAKFGKTMKAFASPNSVDLDKDKDVDTEFMKWFTNRVIDLTNMLGVGQQYEFEADASAFDLMAAAGYDTKELDKIINKVPGGVWLLTHHPSAGARTEALQKLRADGNFGADGGKAPAFPSGIAWPKDKS
jgi:hypothetical protein